MVLLESTKSNMHKIINLASYPNTLTLQTRNKVSSTNTILKKFAKEGISDYILVAKQQTGGRGRYDRHYFSPKSGVYFSFIFQSEIDSNLIPLITPTVAVAVSETLNEYGKNTSIKWVNDVLLNNKKVCGILVETVLEEKPYIIVGIGLNLFNPKKGFPDDIKDIAGYIFDKEDKKIRQDIVIKIIDRFFRYYSDIENKTFTKYYIDHCITLGKDIEIIDVNGNKKEAKAISLTSNLELNVQYKDGTLGTIRTGEVTTYIM